jgi:hypothetical protein
MAIETEFDAKLKLLSGPPCPGHARRCQFEKTSKLTGSDLFDHMCQSVCTPPKKSYKVEKGKPSELCLMDRFD